MEAMARRQEHSARKKQKKEQKEKEPELSPVWKTSRIRELFREHMICKHKKFEFYIPVNVVIRELVGALKKHMEGNDNHHNAQTQSPIFVCMDCDDACSTIQ